MDLHRKEIIEALKECFISQLRADGFKGSFPHFRRKVSPQLQLLSFQFYSSGGSFIVEIGDCKEGEFTTSYGKSIPENKMNVTYVNSRLRLGSNPEKNIDDYWYDFGPRNYDETKNVKSKNFYLDIANEVLKDYQKQANEWWKKN